MSTTAVVMEPFMADARRKVERLNIPIDSDLKANVVEAVASQGIYLSEAVRALLTMYLADPAVQSHVVEISRELRIADLAYRREAPPDTP